MRINTYKSYINSDGHNFLVKETSQNYTKFKCLKIPQDVAEVMKDVFHLNELSEEYVYMIALNSKCKPTGFFEISHGVVNQSLLQPREILIRALLAGASGIILCHNHPSNDTTPSKEDILATKRLKTSCSLIGIELFDHIIICRDSFISLKEQELL